MLKILTILFISVSISFSKKDCDSYSNYLDSNSYIRINGDTNVNDFSCIYKNELLEYLPNCCIYGENGKIELIQGFIEFPVLNFDCGNSMMNRDFQKLLKEEKFNTIDITIENLNETNVNKNDVKGNAKLNINIAGIIKKYELEFFYEKTNDTFIIIKGKKEINIKDFNLEPPTKFLGLVKVKEKVLIEFAFKILAKST